MTSEVEKFDYVVVGAGSAGYIIANRLSACGKYNVCVVEAGPKDCHPMLHIPADFHHQLHHKYLDCNYGNMDMPLDV